MALSRLMTERDELLLEHSLKADEHHAATPVEFFKVPGTIAQVWEDESGTICFTRCAKSLRIDIQFLDNEDRQRNAKFLAECEGVAAAAKAAGYNELVFTTNNPKLAAYCEHAFDYEVVPDRFVLRKQL
jgi:hypothetical protein